jgi:hypothetical protein
MAREKEAFAERWSRLKRESEARKDAPPSAKAGGEAPAPLPPVDKLTADSEFSAFMHPKVQDSLRRAALKKLFSDPRFNVPDPFEPFSGDWTVGETISDEMMATLNQARSLLAPEGEKAAKAEAVETEQTDQEGEARPAEAEQENDEPGKQDT